MSMVIVVWWKFMGPMYHGLLQPADLHVQGQESVPMMVHLKENMAMPARLKETVAKPGRLK